MPTDRGRRPLHHSTTDEENMMTPEQKKLFTDALTHERQKEQELLHPDLQQWDIRSDENLMVFLWSQAEIDKPTGRRLKKCVEEYVQHVSSQPGGARQLREKYGLDSNTASHPENAVPTQVSTTNSFK